MRKTKNSRVGDGVGEYFHSLFDLLPSEFAAETADEKLRNSRKYQPFRYRVKTYKAGQVLECEVFPIWETQPDALRNREHKPTREAQKKLNHRNTQKRVTRLANNNFSSADLWGTFGYDDENLPETPEAARKDVTNFIKRLKRAHDRLGLPPLRYIYVTEWSDDPAKGIRCHNHLILSGELSRDEIERLWKCGAYPQTRRLRVKDDCGLSGLASYIMKASKYERMWGHSRNLKMPIPTVADRKITPKQAESIADNSADAKAKFEKLYSGYTFKSIEVRRSSYVAGAYIYVQMYRKPGATPKKGAATTDERDR